MVKGPTQGKTGNLFAAAAQARAYKPLAERLRPQTLHEMVGQPKLLREGAPLRRLIERGEIPSMILWGPPGCGKTTLARTLANHLKAHFETLSAVMGGVKDIRRIVQEAEERRNYHGHRTLLFIDEIHRFNKAQQDALLPHVESGLFTLVGATTENPSFEVNSALLSRCRVFVLEKLPKEDLAELLNRALSDKQNGLGRRGITATMEVLEQLSKLSQGDARYALGTLEVCCDLAQSEELSELTLELVESAAQQKMILYDKAGDEHYGVVSAFIKSMRGSDPDAAVYWMTRMLEAGEPPRFILRRMVIFASEDIGNADPQALQVAMNALGAFELMGLPEGVLPLTQAATYLACAPKSNAILAAYTSARKELKENGALPVPKKLLNATSGLAKAMGSGKNYKYPHNFTGNYVAESYLPDDLEGARYYHPSDQGYEAVIKERLSNWRGESEEESD